MRRLTVLDRGAGVSVDWVGEHDPNVRTAPQSAVECAGKGGRDCVDLVCVHVVLVLVLAEHRARFAVLAGRAWLLTTAGPLKEMRKTRNGMHVTKIKQVLGHHAWARSAMTRRPVHYDLSTGLSSNH